MNKVQLVGNVGKEPELKYTKGGRPVCNFSMATSNDYKTEGGEWVKRDPTWHNIVVWGDEAVSLKEAVHKGDRIEVEGRIDNRTWDDRDGNKRYISEIVVYKWEKKSRPQPEGQPSNGGDDDLPF